MSNYIRILIFFSFSFAIASPLVGQLLHPNLPYYDSLSATPYERERCVLDLYVPKELGNRTTVIFFHGGGLTGGGKYTPSDIIKYGHFCVSPHYRFSPNVKCPIYIDDAAAAVAWVYHHIEDYGGDRTKIYVTGQSAGGYLTAMLALDKSYLAKYGVDADAIAGYIPVTGQMTTHFTILNERGIPSDSGTDFVDAFAPLFHVRKLNVPILFIIGDRSLDMVGRYKQNSEMVRKLRQAGNITALWEMKTKDHGTVTAPALSEFSRLIAKDSLSFIGDSIFFDAGLSVRKIYDSKEYKEVRVFDLKGRSIDKKEAYSRRNEVLIWRSVDTFNRVASRRILIQ